MSSKFFHCNSGHRMKKEGDMLRCLGKINKKINGKIIYDKQNKPIKVKHNFTKSWSRVEPLQVKI